MNLISLTELSSADVRAIWRLVTTPSRLPSGTVAWSFEGNGIRTRSTFIQAFRALGLEFIELPNFLKTEERVCDLAGYLDPLYDLYVIRESNHARLAEFAAASRRPVINAMSSEGHPCEVLTDAYFIDTALSPIEDVRICLWGPTTNIFRSWHELAKVLRLDVVQICDTHFHETKPNVTFLGSPDVKVDIVITDGWPKGVDALSLTQQQLVQMGSPRLLPTPPFTIGRELAFDPLAYEGFVGYQQKELLSLVQAAILRYVVQDSGTC